MVQSTHHHNAFARTRVQRVLDQNVKRLFLGSMSPSRKRDGDMMQYLVILLIKQAFLPRIG